MSGIEDRLCAALSNDRFALVGAGQLGDLALDLWPEGQARPEFALDSHKQGKLRDVDIKDLGTHRPDPEITYLFSAFKLPVVEAKSIWASLNQLAIFTVYDFFEKHCRQTLSNGWRNLDPSRADLDRIARTRHCYTEEESLSAFDAVVAWRYRRELVDSYPVSPEKDKYNLALFGRNGCFYDFVYDCGSYDLALVSNLAQAQVAFGSFTAFEPDPRRYAICRKNAEVWGPKINVEQQAICDKNGRERFVANGLFSARLVPPHASLTQSIAVQTCTLDSYHETRQQWHENRGQHVLIKAHVESAEPRALLGARKLLERTHADVFVNLSHDETSFLDIPCFLKSFGCFDLFLRSSSLFGEGLTLFARRKL